LSGGPAGTLNSQGHIPCLLVDAWSMLSEAARRLASTHGGRVSVGVEEVSESPRMGEGITSKAVSESRANHLCR
jgi:hypothetical protein